MSRDNRRGTFMTCPRTYPQGREVPSVPERTFETARFTISTPANPRFPSAGAGNPKKNRARILVERRTGLGLGSSACGPFRATWADDARARRPWRRNSRSAPFGTYGHDAVFALGGRSRDGTQRVA